MKDKTNKESAITRRQFLPLLGNSILFPIIGNENLLENSSKTIEDEEYHTVLKSDGTTAKIKISTLKNAKIIENNISNKSFLNWLGRKL